MGRPTRRATRNAPRRPKSTTTANCREPLLRPIRRAKTTRAKTIRAKTAKGEQLPLPLKGSWGGARPGAGRKPTGRAGVPHRARPEHNWRHPVHVSLKVDPTLPNLRTPLCIRTLEACFRAVGLANAKQQTQQQTKEQTQQAQTAQPARQPGRGGRTGKSTKSTENSRIGFRLVHYSVQAHHVHLIVEAQDREALARGLRGLSIRLARQLNKVLGRRGRLFVDRYYARALSTPREVRNGLRYVLLNTTRHESQREAQRRGERVHAARVQSQGGVGGQDWVDPWWWGV